MVLNDVKYQCKDETAIDTIIQKSNRDIYRVLLSLTNYDMTNDIAACDNMPETNVKTFIDSLRKCRTPWTAIAKIREFTYTILHYQYPTQEVMRTFIKCLSLKFHKDADKLCELVTVIANADASLCYSTRPNFVYENLFLTIYQIMASSG